MRAARLPRRASRNTGAVVTDLEQLADQTGLPVGQLRRHLRERLQHQLELRDEHDLSALLWARRYQGAVVLPDQQREHVQHGLRRFEQRRQDVVPTWTPVTERGWDDRGC